MSTLRLLARRISPLRQAVHGARAVHDAWVDRAWNVDTTTIPPGRVRRDDTHDDGLCYEPMRYSILFPFLRPLGLGPEDVVYDIGSGLGRALHACARMGVRRCIGVEIVPEFAERSRRNAERLRGRTCPIETRVEDAARADYEDGTVYLFFNPFGARTLQAVLDRIHGTLADTPRPIRIAYFTPRCEEVLAATPWLRCTSRRASPLHRIVASYWRHDPEDGA